MEPRVSKTTLTPDAVRRDIERLLNYLMEADLAYTVNPVGLSGPPGRQLITWQAKMHGAPLFTHGRHPTVTDYLTWVETGAFSALLMDGALLQITYAVAGGDVTYHRLVYVPAPVPVDDELLNSGDLIEYITQLPFRAADLYLRSPIRFDYDPPSATPMHPASHLTVNGVDCRVPCRTWLPLNTFVCFVFQHFYPDQWKIHDFLRNLNSARGPSSNDRMATEFLNQLHVSWS